jgi:flagellar protein FliS
MNPMMAKNPFAQYQQTQFETAPPERLLLMLYDGAIRFCMVARKAILENDPKTANTHCIKVQNILQELMVTLRMDVGGDLARNLFDLYEYLSHRTMLANVHKQVEPLDEVVVHLKELREAWAQASRNVGTLKAAQASA